MIDLTVDAKTQSLIETVRWLGKEYLRPLGIEADIKGEPIPPDHEFYRRCAELGFMERSIAEEKGKAGEKREKSAARRAVLMAEEASYWDRGMAVTLPGPGLGGPPIQLMGTEEQKKRFLAPFYDRSSPKWGAFAMTEPGAGSDVARITTRAEKKNGKWILNGEKMFCSLSARAIWVVVFATIDPKLGRKGHRAFVVERGTPGFSVTKIEKKMGLLAYETASLLLDNVEVPEENLLGGESYYREREGFVGAMKAFDTTRPVIAAMAVGIGRAALDRTFELLREDGYASRPGPMQAKIQTALAAAKRKLEAAKLLCLHAAWLADVGKANTLEASMAKAYSAQAGMEACTLCLDAAGEAGIRGDYLLEKFFRDVKAMDIVEGTGQIQRIVIARRIVDFPRDLPAAEGAQAGA